MCFFTRAPHLAPRLKLDWTKRRVPLQAILASSRRPASNREPIQPVARQSHQRYLMKSGLVTYYFFLSAFSRPQIIDFLKINDPSSERRHGHLTYRNMRKLSDLVETVWSPSISNHNVFSQHLPAKPNREVSKIAVAANMKLHPEVSAELETIDLGTLQKAIQLVRMGMDPSTIEEPRVNTPPSPPRPPTALQTSASVKPHSYPHWNIAEAGTCFQMLGLRSNFHLFYLLAVACCLYSWYVYV